MTALLLVAIGLFLIIAGFTGRWRAVAHAAFPGFTRTKAA